MGVRRRIAILRDFQIRLHRKKSDVAKLVTREAGKPYVEALLTDLSRAALPQQPANYGIWAQTDVPALLHDERVVVSEIRDKDAIVGSL